jgi:5'-3' exonuclease
MMQHLLVFDLSNLCYIGANSQRNQEEVTVEYYFNAAKEYLRSQYRYFKPDLLVFACDHEQEYWRKKQFPDYKAQRVDSELKQKIRQVIQQFKAENAHLCLEHPGCEADDVIYALCAFTDYRVTIVSSDGDFEQLINDRVRVFNPMQCQFRRASGNLPFDLFVKCIRGDRSDNIPSVMPMVTRRRLQEAFRDADPVSVLEKHDRLNATLRQDYERNRDLIDLSRLPEDLKAILIAKIKDYFSRPQS